MKKVVSASLFTVFGITLGMGMLSFANQMSFPDVQPSDWFYKDVMNMAEWNVIQGNSDGTFAPSRNVNRAELSAMWNRYEAHLDQKFVTQAELSAALRQLESSPVDQTEDTADTEEVEETTTKTVSELQQGDRIAIDGFEYNILNVYKNEYVGSKTNKQKPSNDFFVIVEMTAKNVSNEKGYMGDFLLLGENTQYPQSVDVQVYGEYNFMYPSQKNTVFETGSVLKTYVGFDAHDAASYTLQVKPWSYGNDEKVRMTINKFAPNPKQ